MGGEREALPGPGGHMVGPGVLTGMGQAERPEPQVGRGVGDAAQAVLDGVDRLVHEDLGEVQVLRGKRGHGTSARWGGHDHPPPHRLSLPGR